MAKNTNTGVSTKKARAAYKTVKTELKTLNTAIKQLKTDAYNMNACECLLGGKDIKKMYTNLSNSYSSFYSYASTTAKIQDEIWRLFGKSKTYDSYED